MAGFAPWLAIKLVHFGGEHFGQIHGHAQSALAGAQTVAAAPRKARSLAGGVGGLERVDRALRLARWTSPGIKPERTPNGVGVERDCRALQPRPGPGTAVSHLRRWRSGAAAGGAAAAGRSGRRGRGGCGRRRQDSGGEGGGTHRRRVVRRAPHRRTASSAHRRQSRRRRPSPPPPASRTADERLLAQSVSHAGGQPCQSGAPRALRGTGARALRATLDPGTPARAVNGALSLRRDSRLSSWCWVWWREAGSGWWPAGWCGCPCWSPPMSAGKDWPCANGLPWSDTGSPQGGPTERVPSPSVGATPGGNHGPSR